jgi:dipeptidyl aminopeptidase/acylaminoacyl peptidase
VTNETHSTSLTHIVLTLIAIIGLALFILACRPSWSPDGQKVMYSYWDKGAQESAVAVFDRKSRTSLVIFEMAKEGSSSAEVVLAQWAKAGIHGIVAVGDDAMHILALPQGPQKPVRLFTLQHVDDSDSTGLLPFPQVGDQLFVASPKSRTRINLKTGEIFTFQEKEKNACLLYEAGQEVVYMRGIEEQKPEPKKEGDTQKEGEVKKGTEEQKKSVTVAYEFGELDQKNLSLHPRVTLKVEELKAKGIAEPSGFLDVNPKNLKMASVEDEEDRGARILVIGTNGIEQILEPSIKEKNYKLGNPQWSRDGRMVYVAALIDDEKTKNTKFAVVEVPLDGKGQRIDKIDEQPTKDFDDDYLTHAQLALSPDGQLIAVTRDAFQNVPPEKKGLFLLDVSKPSRAVSFYPAPALPKLPPKD